MGIGLLTAIDRLIALKDGAIGFFTDFNVLFAVEILCFFALIFYVSKVLRDNDATKLMLLFWALILGGGALNVFAEELVGKQVFLFYVILVSAFMLILFNVEVKKSLWDVHSVKDNVEKYVGGTTEIRSQANGDSFASGYGTLHQQRDQGASKYVQKQRGGADRTFKGKFTQASASKWRADRRGNFYATD